MKKVFENSMVAHVWAAQTQELGKSSNGNFYFEGRALWSYGSHFLVGYIMPDGAALLNGSSYSVSTSRHQREAWSATRHRKQFTVPDLTDLMLYGTFAGHETKARTVKKVRGFLFDHSDMTADAAIYLLHAAGVPLLKAGPAFRAIQTKAAAAKAKKARAAEKAQRKENLDYAKRAGEMPEVDFAARVRDLSDHGLKQTAVKLYHAHRAVKAAGRTLQAKAAWDRLLKVRAEVARREAGQARKQARREMRVHIDSLRGALRDIGTYHNEGKAPPAQRMQRAAESARWLYNFGGLGKSARLLSIIETGDAEAKRLRDLENAAELARRADELRAWLNGQGTRGAGLYGLPKVFLRAVDVEREGGPDGPIIGGTLETTMGAKVPLPHAVRAFRFLKLCHDRGQGWKANGHSLRVGHFTVDEVQPDGSFKAGCHDIGWDEVERLARSLGVFSLPAADTTEAR